MSKDLKVSLAFTANTNEAIAQIKNLQKELNSLATGTNLKDSGIAQITPEIQNAMVAAAELQAKLEGAVNVKTGKLDLGKFSESLKKGEKTLTDYARELNALGPAGRQAFQSLAQSVIQAEAPLFRCNNKLKELGTTLANTARWQISSSILHGFMSSVQSAVGYAQNLNESLNNIRIVTGQNTEQMAKFAKDANKAAKELSTTTTEYTNASLIYYQQGLSAAEVKERADVTIKLANVSRQSAETVSDQMTAVWNNFYDGSKSLEYYADVMTSLGAATASSTEEISEGLNKFAAVAETVGLSYEYAAAALATVTATTRQSADVVGTAFKTLFARLQDLELGETLDDGTTLGSYSEALNNVGINIKDVNGDVKDMNDILDELGNKWSSLSKDTQVALAQAVAGTRQYTQLVALMDNWDFFQENLNTATTSTGALNKQAEIYAESWEAARGRVTASAEALYEKILDDDFFIDFLDGLRKAIDGVGKLIDSFGGLKGVLFTVGAFATRLFKDEINQGLRNAAYNIKSLLPSGQREREAKKEEAVAALKSQFSTEQGLVGQAENAALARESAMQEKLLNTAKLLTEEEIKQFQIEMDSVRAADKRAIEAAKIAEAIREEVEEAESLNRVYARIEAIDKARAEYKKNYESDDGSRTESDAKAKGTSEEADRIFDYVENNRQKGVANGGFSSDTKDYLYNVKQSLKNEDNFTRETFFARINSDAKNNNGIAQELLKSMENAGDVAADSFKEKMQNSMSEAIKAATKEASEASKKIEDQVALGTKSSARVTELQDLSSKLSVTTTNSEGKQVFKTKDTGLEKVVEILKKKIENAKNEAIALQKAIGGENIEQDIDKGVKAFIRLEGEIEDNKEDAKALEEILNKLKNLDAEDDIFLFQGKAEDLAIEAAGKPYGGETSRDDKTLGGKYYTSKLKLAKKELDVENANIRAESLEKGVGNKSSTGNLDWSNAITNTTQLIMGLGSAITSVQGLFDTFNNPDASAWDKIVAVFTTLIGILPVASSLVSALGVSATGAGIAINAAMWPVTLTIIAIGAAIAGLIVLFDHLDKKYRADAIAAEKAAEAAQSLSKAYDDAKSSYNDLVATIDNYKSARDGLDDLIKGTQEYSEALNAANEAALNLITTADLVKGKDYDIQQGEIKIFDEALNRAQEEAFKKQQSAYATSTMANAAAAEYQAKAAQTSLVREDNQNFWAAAGQGAINGLTLGGALSTGAGVATGGDIAAGGAAIGVTSVTWPVLAAIAGLIATGGAITGAVKANQNNKTQDIEQNKQIDELILKYNELGEAAFDASILQKLGFDTANRAYIESVKDVVRETNQAAKQIEVAAEISAAAILDTNEKFKQSKNADEIYAASGRIYQENYNKFKEEYSEKDISELWSEYKSELYSLDGFQAGKINEDEGTVSYSYIEDNKRIEAEVSKETMLAALTTAKAEEMVAEAANKLLIAFNDLDAEATGAGKALKSIVAYGNVDTSTEAEFNSLKDAVGQDSLKYAESQDWEALGFNSAQELADAIDEAIKNGDDAWASVGDQLVGSTKEAFSRSLKQNKIFSDLNLNQVQEISELYNKAFEMNGNEGVKKFDSTLKEMFTNAGDNASDLSNILSNVDWQTTNVYDLSNKLEEAGIASEDFQKELQALIDLMKNTDNIGFDAASNLFNQYSEIENQLKESGELDKDQIKILESAGVDIDNFFFRAADGAYKLYNDIDTLYNLLEEKSTEAFDNNIKALEEDNAIISKILEEGLVFDENSYGYSLITRNEDGSYNYDKANSFLSYLDQSGWKDQSEDNLNQFLQLQQKIEDGTFGVLDSINLKNITEDFINTQGGFDIAKTNLSNIFQSNESEIKGNEIAIYSTASLEQLQQLKAAGDITQEMYDKLIDSQENLKNEATSLGLDPEEVSQLADALEQTTEESEIFSEELNGNKAAAQKAALQLARFNKAVKDSEGKLEDWSDALRDDNKDIIKRTKAINEMRQTYADMFDLDPSVFSNAFLESTEYLKLMKQALAGNTEAYNDLQTAIAMDQISQIKEQWGQAVNITEEAIAAITSQKIEAGDLISIDDPETGGLAQQLYNMYGQAYQAARDGGADVATAMAQANALMQAVGFEPPEFELKEIYFNSELPSGYTPTLDGGVVDSTGALHQGVKWSETPSDEYTVGPISMLVPKEGYSIEKSVENLGGSTSTPSGGGSNSKAAEPSKKSNIVQRYKPIDDKLDDQSRALDEASKASDRLWGKDKISNMEKINQLVSKNIDLLKVKRDEAGKYLDTDKTDLINALNENGGIQAIFDENGNISNYEEIMTAFYNELKAAEDAAGAEWDETEQEQLDGIQERIDKVKEAIEQYDETKELIQDLDQEITDALYEWQDNNYEILNLELNLTVEINEVNLEKINYYLDNIKDDIYRVSEGYSYLSESSDKYNSSLEAQSDYYNDLYEARKNNEISQEQYMEGLKNTQAETINNLESLRELKEEAQDYYSNTMQLAQEEISVYTDRMENLNGVLDHYSTLMDLLGKKQDYSKKNQILTASANNLKNEISTQQQIYNNAAAEAAKWEEKMLNAALGSNEYETFKKNWQAAQEAADNAQENILSKTEEWTETMKAIIENDFAEMADIMEKSLTGGISFDSLLTSMERRSSLQEEYLTTTNQIYETNKLMRTAQQEIDKSTNSIAKKKLKNFIAETDQMQNQSKLSKFELEIQQAKYDLLLAEIALEEAQNAKSTVRLQRDSEGNFGYVYTADASQVSDAQQKLEDAQNNLYNIGLEGANNYAQKYAETMKEAQDAITELTTQWMNGEIESEEEYQRRKTEIVETYGEQLKQYSELFGIAVSADSRVIRDSWAADFMDVAASTQDWESVVEDYFDQAGKKLEEWSAVTNTAIEESGLNDLDKTLESITQESDKLKEALIGENGDGGVVSALQTEMAAVSDLQDEYIDLQKTIDATINTYEEFLESLNKEYNNPTAQPSDTTSSEEIESVSSEVVPVEESSTPSLTPGSAVTVKKTATKWSNGEGIWSPVKGNNFQVMETNGDLVLIGNPSGPNYTASGYTGWIHKTNLEGFDTGGYTGEWGPYGKVAMLHEKELVLNATDTQNLLQSMEFLSKVLELIDLQSMNHQLSNITSPYLSNTTDQSLEQNVHIEASFPNAVDHNEIEEAFNNLINTASQYANRK